jgi:ubiquinone/menaquinone biosynthesis C-methylase UbiE
MSVEYLGTDVVAALLDYARGHAPAHFNFRLHPALSVPLPDASVDIACAFSVFTHLLHAETYIYLEEMRRVLRPGGRVIFSFLEFASPAHWDVFQATVAGQRATQTPHLNQFIERSSIETWARHLGFAVERFIDAGAEVEPGAGALGQSMVILRASG